MAETGLRHESIRVYCLQNKSLCPILLLRLLHLCDLFQGQNYVSGITV